MRMRTGMGSFVATGSPGLIVPTDPVLDAFGITVGQLTLPPPPAPPPAPVGLGCGPEVTALGALACASAYPDQNVCWLTANQFNPSAQQGRDVLWQASGLRGLAACVPNAPVVTAAPVTYSPRVTLADMTHPGGYFVGDSFTIQVTGGAPNSAVTYSQNGGASQQIGTTDGSGNFSVSGTWGAGNAGSYTQVYAVGGTSAGSVSFQVVPVATGAPTGTAAAGTVQMGSDGKQYQMQNGSWVTPPCGPGTTWQDDGLNGLRGVGRVMRLGDFQAASFAVPQNPIVKGLAGALAGNSLGRNFASLRGIDTSSLANFMTSVETGTSFGVSNLLLVGGGLALLLMMGNSSTGRGKH